jgi:hypothetical protein
MRVPCWSIRRWLEAQEIYTYLDQLQQGQQTVWGGNDGGAFRKEGTRYKCMGRTPAEEELWVNREHIEWILGQNQWCGGCRNQVGGDLRDVEGARGARNSMCWE